MQILSGLYIVAYFGLLIFLVILAWRFVRAHEDMSRHFLEISRDIKLIAHKKPETPPTTAPRVGE